MVFHRIESKICNRHDRKKNSILGLCPYLINGLEGDIIIIWMRFYWISLMTCRRLLFYSFFSLITIVEAAGAILISV